MRDNPAMETTELDLDDGHCLRIGDDVRLLVVQFGQTQVRFGIQAPRSVPVLRQELLEKGCGSL